MKKIILLIALIPIFFGCAAGGNYKSTEENTENIKSVRNDCLIGWSPFKRAAISEALTNNVVDMMQYYNFEYSGGNLKEADFSRNIQSVGQIMECIENEVVRKDMNNAYVLLSYADKHKSQDAFDDSYEILETLNAYIFSYPITDNNFSDWQINIDTASLNKFYNVTNVFGDNYNTDILNAAYNETEAASDKTLKNMIDNKDREIEEEIRNIYNNVKSDDVFLLIHKVSGSMNKLKFTADNYNPDYDYCNNVKAALSEVEEVNDRLMGLLKNNSLINKYGRISSFINSFDIKYGNNFNYTDINADITELCRMAARLEYIYCNSAENNYNYENMPYINALAELEDNAL